MFFLRDFTDTCTVTVTEAMLKKIKVMTVPTQTAYYLGDTLDTAGLTLMATYNDNSTAIIESGFVCSPMELNTAGTQTVTVTYGDCTDTFDVTVAEIMIFSISVNDKPYKNNYFVGDTLDTAGLTLIATYNDNSTAIIESGFVCSPMELNTAGTQTVTVTYGDCTDTFDVTVAEIMIFSISVNDKPYKKNYFVGDTLDTAGLTLIATYNNGIELTIENGFVCSPIELNTAGTQTITVTYGGCTCTFDVIVNRIDASGLVIEPIPDQTYTGSEITPPVEVKFNGATLTLGTDYTVEYTDNINVGTATVTITGKGNFEGTKSVTFTITAANASAFTVTEIPNQTYTGSEITPPVELKFNGATLTLGTDYTVEYTDNIIVGTATVTITGEGNFESTKTVTFKIVSSDVTATGITLSNMGLPLQYKNTAKLTVTFNPTNATNKNVTWTSNNEKVATVDSSGNVTAKGSGTATITAITEDGGHTASCTVTVRIAWWQWLIKILLFGWIWY